MEALVPRRAAEDDLERVGGALLRFADRVQPLARPGAQQLEGEVHHEDRDENPRGGVGMEPD
jgi:hypothetical protein